MISYNRLMVTLLLAGGLLAGKTVSAQWTGPRKKVEQRIEVKYGPLTPAHRTDEAMARFRSYGLGQFIHWGLYAIPGNEWEGVSARKGAAASEWIRTWSGPTAPKDWKNTYDNLYKQFNPKGFDAKLWAKQAKEMGAKYLIFTTKHHDGFALWPSKYTDYTIKKSPYKKDIVKQVVDAYTAEGIDVFLYFSILEWNNSNYMGKAPSTPEEKAKFNKFLEYTRNQLLELLQNYPQIKGFWFDGTWDQSWIQSYDFTYKLEKELREKHPGLIIGSRFRNDEFGKRHFDSNGDMLGDYEQGWERKMPKEFEWLEGRDWDCVMTIPPNGWGYMKDWSGIYTKTSDDLIDMLMNCVSMNGNFVLNFGPDGNGRMHPGEDKLAKEIGDWIKVNGEAVYGVRHAGLAPSKLGYFTKKEDNLYLTVFNRPVNNIVRIAVPKNATTVPVTAALLQNGQTLVLKQAEIGIDLDKNTYYDIVLPDAFVANKAFVIKMKLGHPKGQREQLMDAKM
ncbi:MULTISPECIES: alpha-L-fucosidase [Sphingobacterium]|jgi:alpha-L-fucosidase|uniref:alpha-L-fucosidase n=1 Tax=Sphingobacterium TaxID=28453 RepID=UPI00095D02E6|nr:MULTISPECIES: alpha-L-fucosidase [Sphingobacterium]MDF2851852.1 alpha-L-fucosidase [Sphingobacterium multivorum]OJZ03210.1 MAG: alpha-L-fucosidase [Sphingobacterium sp. 40-24]